MKSRNTYEYQKARGLKRKMELIRLKGGSCEACGYKTNISALEFHHKDPSKKDMKLDLRRLANTKWETLLKEAEKCMLLCANHHREIHNPDKEFQAMEELVKQYEKTIVSVRTKNTNTCDDCGSAVAFYSKRCKSCNDINRRKTSWPDKEALLKEVEENGHTWCGKKYEVSRRTIKR